MSLGKKELNAVISRLHLSVSITGIFLGIAFLLSVCFLHVRGVRACMPGTVKMEILSSPDGRFSIFSTNTLVSLELLKWAEDTVDKITKVAGLKVPAGGRASRLNIMLSPVDLHADAGVVTEERIDNGELSLYLKIPDYKEVDKLAVNEAFCRLVLYGHVAAVCAAMTEFGQETNTTGKVVVSTNTVPAWLYRGLSRFIYPEVRAGDVETVLRVWKNGTLKPFPESMDAIREDKSYPYASVYTTFVGWFASLPYKDNLFGKIFERLSRGEKVSPEWLSCAIPECTSVSDMDEKWENWLATQLRAVYKPGSATALQIEQLIEKLVLRQGDIGMPLSTNISTSITFRNLVGIEQEAWMPVVLKNKISDIRLLGMGKGQEFNDVVEKFCAFLEAVSAGRDAGVAQELLDKAEMDLEILHARFLPGSCFARGSK